MAQFGHRGKSGGSSDTANLGGPANLTVDFANNELYVADGYRNRRVIVIDTRTLAFKRMWGAYGNKPDDKNLGPYNPDAPGAAIPAAAQRRAVEGWLGVCRRPRQRSHPGVR